MLSRYCSAPLMLLLLAVLAESVREDHYIYGHRQEEQKKSRDLLTRHGTRSFLKLVDLIERYSDNIRVRQELKESMELLKLANLVSLSEQPNSDYEYSYTGSQAAKIVIRRRLTAERQILRSGNSVTDDVIAGNGHRNSVITVKRSAALQCVMKCLDRVVAYLRCHALCN